MRKGGDGGWGHYTGTEKHRITTRKGGRKGGNKRAQDPNNHAVDGLRYAVMARPTVLPSVARSVRRGVPVAGEDVSWGPPRRVRGVSQSRYAEITKGIYGTIASYESGAGTVSIYMSAAPSADIILYFKGRKA